MTFHTASAIMSLYGRLEDQAVEFFEALAGKYLEHNCQFVDLAAEHRKEREMVLRAYREGITDTAEVGFSFEGLDESQYAIELKLKKDRSLTDDLRKALEVEEKTTRFCLDASRSSRGLLSDISQAFERSARRKNDNKRVLERLLEEAQ